MFYFDVFTNEVFHSAANKQCRSANEGSYSSANEGSSIEASNGSNNPANEGGSLKLVVMDVYQLPGKVQHITSAALDNGNQPSLH